MAKPTPETPADIDRVGELLVEASKLSNHKEFVIIGSLSVLASEIPAPDEMLMSDAVSPFLAALPDGWEERLHRVAHPEGVIGLLP